MTTWQQVPNIPGVFVFRDVCNVYALKHGKQAFLIDYGTGLAASSIASIDVEVITDVFVTHYHIDQVAGLVGASSSTMNIWIPPVERDLLMRPNDPTVASDVTSFFREVPPAPIAPARLVQEYVTQEVLGTHILPLPTPGHTIGSISYLIETGGQLLAFSGDLLFAPGQVQSTDVFQWTPGGVEGYCASALSLTILAGKQPDLILPSHGDVIQSPVAALHLTADRLERLAGEISPNWGNIRSRLHRPWEEVTPHFLRNRTSWANSYALLSPRRSAALIFDWGYDQFTGLASSGARAARRPLLTSLEYLRSEYGIEQIDAVLPTHYHDDHVAGINQLREVEGAEVWAPEVVASIIRDPTRYDLPAKWFDPIEVDRVLAMGTPIVWNEHEILIHPFPGHSAFAVAYEVRVDAKVLLISGDQESATRDPDRRILNYQYANRPNIGDFTASVALYRRLRPDVVLPGHDDPFVITEPLLRRLELDAERFDSLHRALLSVDELGRDLSGVSVRIDPYEILATPGEPTSVVVNLKNPIPDRTTASVSLVAPMGWQVSPGRLTSELARGGSGVLTFRLTPPSDAAGRFVIAADVSFGDVRFGQHAEAFVEVAASEGLYPHIRR